MQHVCFKLDYSTCLPGTLIICSLPYVVSQFTVAERILLYPAARVTASGGGDLITRVGTEDNAGIAKVTALLLQAISHKERLNQQGTIP
jgi:hypothetical protein